jgi:hypothetical protein
MSKYDQLTEFLVGLDGEKNWKASIAEIEKVLGFSLPDSAHDYQAWWANQGRAQSLAWESAGWKTTNVDLKNETITFLFVGVAEEADESELDEKAELAGEIGALTLAEAKAGLALAFGVPEKAIEIVIRA